MTAPRVALHLSKPETGEHAGEVFGLDVAFNNVLRALLRYSKLSHFHLLCPRNLAFEHFCDMATREKVDVSRVTRLDVSYPAAYADFDVLFRPDPLALDLAWPRLSMRGIGPALCGIIHTMSGERVAAKVNQAVLGPVETGDALICPSNAIRDANRELLAITAEFYEHRFGGKLRPAIDFPVIPLGVDAEVFAAKTTAEKRAAQRSALNLAEDELLILHVGRLSFATKMYPTAMLLAAERAAITSGRKVRFVMLGYFKPEEMETPYRAIAEDVCKTVRHEYVMNNDPRFPEGLWAAADIFLSFSDNIQESFGLVPIEAMAAGLPAVISDWDGYRDGIRHGIDGFRIPTLGPGAAAGQMLAEAYLFQRLNYGEYLAGAAMATAVDVDVAAAALHVLLTDDGKRKSMGETARQRAMEHYDWSRIIPQYEDLWADQAQKRKRHAASAEYAGGAPAGWPAAHPDYPNPFAMFHSFPTRMLDDLDEIAIVATLEEMQLLWSHGFHRFVKDVLLPDPALQDLITRIGGEGVTVQSLIDAFSPELHDALRRSLVWLVKMGFARVKSHA